MEVRAKIGMLFKSVRAATAGADGLVFGDAATHGLVA
jgi:hypothetical protein